jgi:hypothetical protein
MKSERNNTWYFRTNFLSDFTSETGISIRALKKTHGELDPKNPVNSIIDSAHGDNAALNLGCQIIDVFSVPKRNHDLQNNTCQSMVRKEENGSFVLALEEITIVKDVS